MHTTAEEEKAIEALRRVAATWPDSLWLFAASGTLEIMKKRQDGKRAMLPNKSVDDDYVVGIIGIPCDGGDY